jgi:hypothetical protein
MVVILSGIWSGKMTVPPGTVLGSGKYYVLTGDPRWIHGTNGTAVLTSSIGEEIDRTPMLNDTKSDDFTWSRWPNGRDSDRISDWAYIPSSKGRANKVPYTDQ